MNPYIFIAIGIVVVLAFVFVFSFYINRKIPVPKGCEDIKISEENCMGCSNSLCDIKQKIDIKKIEEEIKEENK